MRVKKLIKQTRRLEDLLKSYKWKWKNGNLLSDKDVDYCIYIFGYLKSFTDNIYEKRREKKVFTDYLTYLKGVCEKTNINYCKKWRWF